jgi:transposase
MAQRNRAFSRGGLQVTHPDAAGVDVGGATHYASVRADATDEPVRQFCVFQPIVNGISG